MQETLAQNSQTEAALHGYNVSDTVAKTDQQLLAQVGKASREALEILYDRHCAGALGAALQILPDRARAEQLIQEVFWWVWKHPLLYQRGDGKFTDWFYTIVRHLAFKELYFEMTEPLPGTREELERMLKQNPSASQDETWALTDALTAEEIRVAFSGLPAKQRQVIGYAYYQGMTRHEIAERLGVSIDIVATWARLGLAQFGERIRLKGAARANVAHSGLMGAGGGAPESRTERMV